MNLIEKIRAKARANQKKIVLPEGDEPRTVVAAAEVVRERLARPILLGSREKVASVAAEKGVDVGAKAAVYEILGDLAQQGYAIILISSEMRIIA